MKFMATNTGSLVAAANAIGNVPTTYDSLESPELSLPEQFDTFLDVFSNPNSHYKDMSVLGSATRISWRASRRSGNPARSPTSKLVADVAGQINDQLEQAGVLIEEEERSPEP